MMDGAGANCRELRKAERTEGRQDIEQLPATARPGDTGAKWRCCQLTLRIALMMGGFPQLFWQSYQSRSGFSLHGATNHDLAPRPRPVADSRVERIGQILSRIPQLTPGGRIRRMEIGRQWRCQGIHGRREKAA
jgi:hypothetical protein